MKWFWRKNAKVEPTVRVEKGPARKTAIPTEELLDYLRGHYRSGGYDAMGKTIVLGESMTYLDYRGEWVWYIYKFDKNKGRWLPAGVEKTEKRAIVVARNLED